MRFFDVQKPERKQEWERRILPKSCELDVSSQLRNLLFEMDGTDTQHDWHRALHSLSLSLCFSNIPRIPIIKHATKIQKRG